MYYLLLLFCIASLQAPLNIDAAVATCPTLTAVARDFFERENRLFAERRHVEFSAAYTYNTNVTEANRQTMIRLATKNAEASKALAMDIKASGFSEVCDHTIKRQVERLTELGFDVLNETDYIELQNAISAMQTNYATTKVCSYLDRNDCTLTLEPHIQELFATSRDPKELAHYWREWHDKAGMPMRKNFAKYVQLSRKASNLNKYRSYADYWVHFYEDPDFEMNLDAAYKAILPLYTEIHGYVRYRLRQHYGDKIVSEKGPIPMHLLGNMWAQQWDQSIDLYTPYPDKPFVDVTAEMERQEFTVQKMFELGDQFFQSLNMRALPKSFWNLSVLERPADRQIVCHASAWDLFTSDSDVRIKMCTEVNTHYLYVVHHELGHIQYYLQYEQQPTTFRGAPNPGFHEAVGDVIALSVSTPKHLHRIGLMPSPQLDEQSRINELFKTALKKIVFLPFAISMDKFRYAVFRAEMRPSNWNCAYWRLRSAYSGVEPPIERTRDDFDPPAKYHINADVEYLRYFAAHIFQFQFHKALCSYAGQYEADDPQKTLDNCDIYNSKEAGKVFAKLLSTGASKHWKEVLQEFSGDTEMDSTALLEYFEPLRKWLKAENKRLNVPLGWTDTDKIDANCCSDFST